MALISLLLSTALHPLFLCAIQVIVTVFWLVFSNSLDKGGFAGEFQPIFPTLLRRGRNTKQMESQRAQTDGDKKFQELTSSCRGRSTRLDRA